MNNNTKLKVNYIPIDKFAEITEDAMFTRTYGIYIPCDDGLHVYHGSQDIDRDLCADLNIRVVDLKYDGGNIIGSEADLSVLVILPEALGATAESMINKAADIISNYVPNVTVDGNDILVSGDKVCGTTARIICGSFVWTAQISFADYSEYIAKICTKPQVKKPTFIDSSVLTRDQLEEEILQWLSTFTI